MAICPYCHQANADTAAFCASCGTRISADLPPSQIFTAVPKGEERHNAKATAGLVLGILSLFAWFLPFIGFPVTIIGLVMSAIGLKSRRPGWAVAGLVMSILGLIATIVNAILGAVIGFSAL